MTVDLNWKNVLGTLVGVIALMFASLWIYGGTLHLREDHARHHFNDQRIEAMIGAITAKHPDLAQPAEPVVPEVQAEEEEGNE